MILLALILCLLTCLFLLYLKKFGLAFWWLGLVTAALTILGFSGPASFLLQNLQLEPSLEARWGAKNSIVILGGGISQQSQKQRWRTHSLSWVRVYEGFHQFQECLRAKAECTIVVSGGDPHHVGQTEAQIMSDELVSLGVPKQNVILEDRSHNTFQNAEFTSQILNNYQPDTVVLVTSGFHLRRAATYFKNFGIQTQPAPADRLNGVQSRVPTAYNLALVDFCGHEYLGLLRYQLYQWLGLNLKLNKAGQP